MKNRAQDHTVKNPDINGKYLSIDLSGLAGAVNLSLMCQTAKRGRQMVCELDEVRSQGVIKVKLVVFLGFVQIQI